MDTNTEQVDYQAAIAKGKERALGFINDPSGWKECSKTHNDALLIESRPSDKINGSVFRVTLSMKVPLEAIRTTWPIMAGNKRLCWDTDLKDIEVLHRVSDDTWLQVSHSNKMAKGLISPREFVDVVRMEDGDDGFVFSGVSVDYPQIKSTESYVRGVNGSFILTACNDPEKPGYVKAGFIMEMDFKGRLPKYLVDSAMPMILNTSFERWLEYLKTEGILEK